MNQNKIKNFNSLDHEVRYSSFLETILGNDEVWILQADDGILGIRNSKDELLIPFWRDEELVDHYVTEMNEIEYEKTNVDINTLIDEILVDMINENQLALIDQMPNGNGALISPEAFKRDILRHFEDYS